MILSDNRNFIRDDGIRLLTHKNVNIVGTVEIEAPVKLNSVTLMNTQKIGAFSYIEPGSCLNNVTSIGRYCSIAMNVVMWNRNHSTAMLSTHPMFCNVGTQWNSAFADYSGGGIRMV